MINISMIEFTRRLFKGGGVSLKGAFLLPAYYIQIIPALGFAFVQYIFFGQRIKNTVITKDPVFILGHYRSGTTYLQKLLASNKMFGFLTNYDALLPNSNLLFGNRLQNILQLLVNFLKIKNPFFHNSIVRLSEVAEEDDYLMNKASAYTAYWGLVFPKRWREWLNGSVQFMDKSYADGWKREYMQTIKYATFKNKGKQLVLKSPPNTERISILLQMFPQAKFIFIYRNPFHMFYSIKNMWKTAILKNYSVQKISDEQLDEIVFEHFIYINEQYEKNKYLIPGGNLVEISYEELKKDPFNTIKKIYSSLNLPGFEIASADLGLQIDMEREYQNFHYEFSKETFHKIEEKWGKYIRKWNYNLPESPSPLVGDNPQAGK